jgi:hypothetical protein
VHHHDHRATGMGGRRAIAAVAGLLLLASACGGQQEQSPGAEEYRAQADRICERFEEQTEALGRPSSASQVPAFLDRGLAITRRQVEELRELTPPEELKADHDVAIELLDQQTEDLQLLLDTIRGGEAPNAAAARFAPDLDRLDAELTAKAQELGLRICGRDTSGAATTTGDDAPASTGSTSEETTDTDEAPTATTSTTPRILRLAQIDVYLTDVRAAATALNRFGARLRASSTVAALRARGPELSNDAQTFEESINRMRGYRISEPALERQRAAMVEEGDEVADQLSDFAAAAAAGDPNRIQDLIPGARRAVDRLGEAAEAASQG